MNPQALADSTPPARRPCLVYAAGPGDVLATYRHWREGREDPAQVALTYSGQFFDVCRELDATAVAICTRHRYEAIDDPPFLVLSRPKPFAGRGGLLYHVGQVWDSLRLAVGAIRRRADAVVIGNDMYMFPFVILRPFGIRAIPALHCVLWLKGQKPAGAHRVLRRLDRAFFRRGAAAILTASRDVANQVVELTGGRHAPILPFLPTYRIETFEGIPGPPADRRPFRVLYVGRIEATKGVFDLLGMAKRLREAGRMDIEFDLCGTGSALEELKRRADEAGLAEGFRCHGHCPRPAMREMYGRCHIVIAPTTSRFVEGFNQVVVEGVLTGRPLITSSVCPAIEYVRDAIVEVPPDDVEAYTRAILRLADDPVFYEAKRAACAAARGQFYDPNLGWAGALRRALAHAGISPEPSQRLPDARPTRV